MKLPSDGLPLNASKLGSTLDRVLTFSPASTGTHAIGFCLASHVPCYPLKGSVLTAVRKVGGGDPGWTNQSNRGIVGAESGLCATIHRDSSFRVQICFACPSHYYKTTCKVAPLLNVCGGVGADYPPVGVSFSARVMCAGGCEQTPHGGASFVLVV